MSKFKLVVLTNCLWHVCLLLGCPIAFLANICGAIPVAIYAAILCNIIKPTDTYLKGFLKSLGTFAIIAFVLAIISDMLLVGMVFSFIGITLSLILQPTLLKYCKNEKE